MCAPTAVLICAHLSVKVRDVCGYVSVCVRSCVSECLCSGYEKYQSIQGMEFSFCKGCLVVCQPSRGPLHLH